LTGVGGSGPQAIPTFLTHFGTGDIPGSDPYWRTLFSTEIVLTPDLAASIPLLYGRNLRNFHLAMRIAAQRLAALIGAHQVKGIAPAITLVRLALPVIVTNNDRVKLFSQPLGTGDKMGTVLVGSLSAALHHRGLTLSPGCDAW
jgi:hypothetical protein